MITFENIGKVYKGDGLTTPVLDSVSFNLPAGSFTTLFGPNGCGKSTLFNIISGLDSPSWGKISGLERAPQQIGFVFQDYRKSLLPWLNCNENIVYPLRLRGVSRAARQKRLNALVDLIRPDFELSQPVFTLSGGQAQMVALLRALIIAPKLLLLDEPFSALDYMRTLAMRQKLAEVASALRLSVLCISHDLEEALFLGDQLVLLSSRPTHVIEVVPIEFSRPRSPALLANAAFLELRGRVLQNFLCALGAVSFEPGLPARGLEALP